MEKSGLLTDFPCAKVVDQKNEIEDTLLEKRTSYDGLELCHYNGFWLPVRDFRPIIRCQKYFKAQDTDIILCTNPKSGTTWLKALTFTIANRHIYSITDDHHHPLLTTNPQDLIPSLVVKVYKDTDNPINLENIPSPRIFATHIPYQLLPRSIRDSKCRIIHISRNPLDQFISRVHFAHSIIGKDVDQASVAKAFDEYCRGFHIYGPLWDLVRGYWDAHVKDPEKVLFLMYEDLKEDICSNVKKIAQFIGMPFSDEEEKQGLVEKIAALCSFDNLKNLEVNKVGKLSSTAVKNSSFFRKGQVGDWTNYLTPIMVQRLDMVLGSKLEGSGLVFKYSDKSQG